MARDNYDKLRYYARLKTEGKSPCEGGFVRAAPVEQVPAGPSPQPEDPAEVIPTNSLTVEGPAVTRVSYLNRYSGPFNPQTGGSFSVTGCPPPWPPTGAVLTPVTWYANNPPPAPTSRGFDPVYLGTQKYVACYDSESTYLVYIGLLAFDTSSVPDAATVTGATLRLYHAESASPNQRSVVLDWAAWTLPWGVAGDWADVAGTSAHGGIAISQLPPPYDAYVTDEGNWVEFPLTNATANVNKTGWTYLKMQISGGAPEVGSGGGRTYTDNSAQFFALDFDPKTRYAAISDYDISHQTSYYQKYSRIPDRDAKFVIHYAL